MSVGVLTAEREGPDIKFTMELPTSAGPKGERHDHFMVERFSGMKVNDRGERVEVWEPVHTGTRKWVACGDEPIGIEYERAPRVDHLGRRIDNPDPVPGGKFRAIALYRFAEPDTQVRVLHTYGQYSGSVTVP